MKKRVRRLISTIPALLTPENYFGVYIDLYWDITPQRPFWGDKLMRIIKQELQKDNA